MAEIVRSNLKARQLDIPGTAYYDESLGYLSEYYNGVEKRFYYVVTDEADTVLGGGGLAEFTQINNCAELQKLYIADAIKGKGIGRRLMELIEEKAREYGYDKMYLETHTNLTEAIHLYEKMGYKLIEKPEGVVHATMNRFYIKEL
ncbi:MAG: GNAT family N-acetyltransferase [Lachnospiraceae bacterium]|nr:GNAT family N-acetyltransferase [Lachnospiraceae bacterium]